MGVQPYLIFDGRCEEALEFYKKAIGAEVVRIMRNKESPEPAPPGTLPPGSENKIMHSTFREGETTIMASDGYAKGNPRFEGFSLSLSAANEAEADRLFKALAQGAPGARAPRQDFLREEVRHAGRQVRRGLDRHHGDVSGLCARQLGSMVKP